MPMNQFLFDQQLAAMKVDRSGWLHERSLAIELMEARAKRVADWRFENGLSNMGWPGEGGSPVSTGR
ncbi:hypothetical protein CD351_14540 [Erythrobacter sp. KY5]|nr:hypothetical protein CD351_14540 [Erythrobacter sp. KY5]